MKREAEGSAGEDDDHGVDAKKRNLTHDRDMDPSGSPALMDSPESRGGSEGWVQTEGAQSGGVGASGQQAKVGPKVNGSKASKKGIGKVGSPGFSDDEGDLRSGEADLRPGVGPSTAGGAGGKGDRGKEEEEEEEENLELEFGKYHTVDPDKMRAVLAKFTPEQMSRYECYRRSGFQRANMRRLLQGVAGCPISVPMTIVMSGISKMFVGELVETGRIVMTERQETGPIRPCHIREAYRRLKLEGKVPLRARPRLFH